MRLIVYSLLCGFLGFWVGTLMSSGLFMAILGVLGTLSPSIYVLDKLYKNANAKVSHEDIDETIEFLRDDDILSEDEYKKAIFAINKKRKETEKQRKYNKGISIIESLLNEKVISESELLEKKKLLKNRLSQ